MTIGTAMAPQTGEHQPESVQQFGGSAKGTPNARHRGPLVEGQRRRDGLDGVDVGL